MNQTFVGCSLYHIYISILLANENKKKGFSSLLIIIEEKVENLDSLKIKLKNLDLFDDVISIKSYSLLADFKNSIGLFNYIFNRQKSLVKLIEENNLNLSEVDYFIKKSEINLFHVVRSRAYFLIKYSNNKFRMIEEGLGTYYHKMSKFRYLKRKYLIKFPLLMGYDNQVKEILVQYPERMKDNFLKSKSKKLDLVNFQRMLSDSESKKIIRIFLDIDMNFLNTKKAIVITQPLSEDKKMSEKDKIEFYLKIVDILKQKGYSVYFKQHPREKTNYDEYFNDIIFIPKSFPIELFNLMHEISFDLGITYYSGSLENLVNVKKKISFGIENVKNVKKIISGEIKVFT